MTASAPWLLLVVLTNSISAYYFYYYSVTIIARSALARGVARRLATSRARESSLVESHSVNKGALTSWLLYYAIDHSQWMLQVLHTLFLVL